MTTLSLSRPVSRFSFSFSALKSAVAAQRSRAALARLDASMLADIGLTTDMAEKEAKRPFWDF